MICTFVSGAAGWLICYLTYPEFSPEYIKFSNELVEKYPEWENYIVSPEELEKMQDDVVWMRKAAADESEEFIFGVAYGNYKVMKYDRDLGAEEAKKKSAYAIKKFLEMYPDMNWGIHQKMADEIENWVVQNPDYFKDGVEQGN